MTKQEKQQLVDAVMAQLKNEGTDVSSATVVKDVNGVSYVLCYDTNGNIVRVSPDTINQQESTNKDAIKANATAIANETQRAQDAEQALGMALQNGLNQEATARDNLAKEIKSNAMQYDTLGVYVRADKAEIYGRSIDTTPRVVEFPAATTEKAGVMTAGDKKKVNASIKDIVVNPNVDDVELDLENNTEKTSHVVFPAATAERAGVMSAEDKKNLAELGSKVSDISDEIYGRYNRAVADEVTIGTSNVLFSFSMSMLVEEGDILVIGVDGYETTNTGNFTCYLFDSEGVLLSNSFIINSSTSNVAVAVIKSGTLKSISFRASSSCVLSATLSILIEKGLKEKTKNIVSDSIAKGEPSLCIIGKDGGVLFSSINEKTYNDHAYHSTVDIENNGGFVDGRFGEEGTFYGLPVNLINGIKISFDVEFAKDLQNKTDKSVNFMNIGGFHGGVNGNITLRFSSPNTENIQVANEVRVMTDQGRKVVRYDNYNYPYEDAFMGNIAFSIKGDNKTVTIDDYGLYVYSKENEALLFSVPFEGHETLRSWSDALCLSASNNGVDVELFDVENKTTHDLLMQNKIDISGYPLYARTIKEGKTNIEVILRSDAEKQYIDMFVDGQIALGNREIQNASGLKYKQSYVVIGGEGVKVSNIKVCHNDIARTSPRLIVVMLHSIRPDNYTGELGMWITPSLLKAELDLFAKHGYENISVEDVVEYMRNGKSIPKRAFAIIHDDDYYFGSKIGIKEFEDVRRMYYNRNIKAGFAIIPNALNDNEKKEEVIARLKKDSNLFSFGVHGYEHEVWEDLSFEEAKEKLSLAISLFEELVGYSPRYFVYPTNNYGWRTITNLFENSQFSVAFANNTASAHIGVGRSCCKMALSRIDGAQSMDIIESLIK